MISSLDWNEDDNHLVLSYTVENQTKKQRFTLSGFDLFLSSASNWNSDDFSVLINDDIVLYKNTFEFERVRQSLANSCTEILKKLITP